VRFLAVLFLVYLAIHLANCDGNDGNCIYALLSTLSFKNVNYLSGQKLWSKGHRLHTKQ